MESITHKTIHDRAMDSARDAAPDLPTSNEFDAWESFADAIEGYRDRAHEIAAECADSWDWVIYYGKAMQVCMAVDSPTLHDAESRAYHCGGSECDESTFGLYETAAKIASHICESAITDAIYMVADELDELAQSQMDNAA